MPVCWERIFTHYGSENKTDKKHRNDKRIKWNWQKQTIIIEKQTSQMPKFFILLKFLCLACQFYWKLKWIKLKCGLNQVWSLPGVPFARISWKINKLRNENLMKFEDESKTNWYRD